MNCKPDPDKVLNLVRAILNLKITMKNLYQKREKYRAQIKTFWKSGINWTKKEHDVLKCLNNIHAQIIQIELLDDTKPQVRNNYSICGWSERHGYFRNKRLKVATIEEAKIELDIAKSETESEWGIPTVIVKETFYRANSPAMVDFDGDVTTLAISDKQEIMGKSMCGNKHYRWRKLIKPTDDRFTY